jgi:hypothetical protein
VREDARHLQKGARSRRAAFVHVLSLAVHGVVAEAELDARDLPGALLALAIRARDRLFL